MPDFYENSIKSCARLERKKSRKRGARKKFPRKYRAKRRGVHPPPPGWLGLTLIRLGGGAMMAPPLDISRDYSATREALAATLYDNFLSSFPHILTQNLWRPGVRFRSYVTLCTCTSDRKWLQNVILCTKSMQIEFSHLVHINMHIFTLNCWN